MSVSSSLTNAISTLNEDVWLRMALLAQSMNDADKAFYCFQNSLRHNPRNPVALYHAGALYRKHEQYAKAVFYFQQTTKIAPETGIAWVALGHCFLMLDQLNEAYSAYQQALHHLSNPKDPQLWYGIGILYERFKSYDHALEAYTAVLSMDKFFPKSLEVRFRRAMILKLKQDFTECCTELKQLVDSPPPPLSKADVWCHIADVEERQNKFDNALNAYEEALKLAPDNSKILQQFGWFCHGQAVSAQDMAEVTTSEKPPSGGGSSETEADSLRRARGAETEATRNGRMLPTSDVNASNDNSTSRSGSVRTKRKRAASVASEPDADTEHAAATASDDDAPTASRNGSVPVAPADATNVTPANTLATPQHFDTIAPLSHSSLAQQWFARAEDLLQRSLTIDSSNAITHYLLGRCFMAQHKARDAYQAYQQAVYLDADNATYWCSIGALYSELKQQRDALDAYSRAIALDGTLIEAWINLGSLYESCNQVQDALGAYNRAHKLDPSEALVAELIEQLSQEAARESEITTANAASTTNATE